MPSDNRMIEIERPPITETAVLVRLVLPNDSDEDVAESLEEMRQLAWTAGADVATTFVQHRSKPCPATLIGAGKVAQVRTAVEEHEANIVIFDSDLTPAQGAKLEDILGTKVVDRTQLILDIFAQRAQTNEGKHQVELAQLQYLLPRLAGRGSVMRQQGGIGVRGPGEQKLEVDRRVIRKRIDRLKSDLENIRRSRQLQRKQRMEDAAATVALVGYTNAGKSSLLNALTGADVFVENKLFATLDPRARRCMLPGRREIVLTDTVGFIQKLPHSLVAAFRATLEVVNEADLILLVVDASHPAAEEHIKAVRIVLEEIQAHEKSILFVFNKMDIAERAGVEQMAWNHENSVLVSARTAEGLDRLREEIAVRLSKQRRKLKLRIPQDQARWVARIHADGRVLSEAYEDNTILLEAEVGPALESQLKEYLW